MKPQKENIKNQNKPINESIDNRNTRNTYRKKVKLAQQTKYKSVYLKNSKLK